MNDLLQQAIKEQQEEIKAKEQQSKHQKQPETAADKVTGSKEVETKQPESGGKRGRGRPANPDKQKRTKQIAIFVTPDLYARVREMAWREHKSLNGYINNLLDSTSVPFDEVSPAILEEMQDK